MMFYLLTVFKEFLVNWWYIDKFSSPYFSKNVSRTYGFSERKGFVVFRINLILWCTKTLNSDTITWFIFSSWPLSHSPQKPDLSWSGPNLENPEIHWQTSEFCSPLPSSFEEHESVLNFEKTHALYHFSAHWLPLPMHSKTCW